MQILQENRERNFEQSICVNLTNLMVRDNFLKCSELPFCLVTAIKWSIFIKLVCFEHKSIVFGAYFAYVLTDSPSIQDLLFLNGYFSDSLVGHVLTLFFYLVIHINEIPAKIKCTLSNIARNGFDTRNSSHGWLNQWFSNFLSSCINSKMFFQTSTALTGMVEKKNVIYNQYYEHVFFWFSEYPLQYS